MRRFDVIVVGAGASGAVVAARLTEDPACQVLLLEAGPDFPQERELPPQFAHGGERVWFPPALPEFDWGLYDAPLENGRRVRLPRGKLVGGSSMVNATVAVRGADFDFDRWSAMGNEGWSWEEVLPRFVKLENDLDFPAAPYHGSAGPIVINRYPVEEWAPVHEPFIEACVELGLSHVEDLNAPGADVATVGAWPHNRFHEVRLGTLPTYVRAARERANFTIAGNALVDRVLLDGTRATGVRCVEQNGNAVELEADLVVLAGGAYGTPPVLERSGIGEPQRLRAAGIEPLHDLPVGENLLDHPNCPFIFAAPELSAVPGRLFATNCRAPLGADGEPEWQGFAMPIEPWNRTAGVIICLNRQDAAGGVHVRSADPGELPAIDHRYLALDSDLRRFEHAWSFMRELISRPAFARYGARELTAGKPVREILLDRLSTAHHPCGSCRMGPAGDERAVVDPALRVHGIDGLMVADASIFPDNIMNNPNLTCMMVGELAAELIAGWPQGRVAADSGAQA